jgi:hypothetical protein
MTIDANTNTQVPLRAGYNSLVPDIDKWQQFDRDLKLAQQLQQQTRLKPEHRSKSLLRHWQSIMQKLQTKPARSR